MRKLLCTLVLAMGLVSFSRAGNYSDVTFFGTDFSLAKVYGSTNLASQFQDAFKGINALFLSEPKKYNPDKLLGVPVNKIDLNPVDIRIRNMDLSNLLLDGYGGYELTDQQIEQAIKALQIEAHEGTGAIVVAEVLNKASNQGTFKVVFFDIATRDVLEVREGKGKARGFGLRNFWAYSMLGAMKDAK